MAMFMKNGKLAVRCTCL